MVGWAGQPKGWPESLMAGFPHPVQLTTRLSVETRWW
ncbi:ash family protein [Yersinia ruckeri]